MIIGYEVDGAGLVVVSCNTYVRLPEPDLRESLQEYLQGEQVISGELVPVEWGTTEAQRVAAYVWVAGLDEYSLMPADEAGACFLRAAIDGDEPVMFRDVTE